MDHYLIFFININAFVLMKVNDGMAILSVTC